MGDARYKVEATVEGRGLVSIEIRPWTELEGSRKSIQARNNCDRRQPVHTSESISIETDPLARRFRAIG